MANADNDNWSQAIAALEEHDRTGVWFAAQDSIIEFRANVEARLADAVNHAGLTED